MSTRRKRGVRNAQAARPAAADTAARIAAAEKIKDKEIILFFNGASPFDEATLKNTIKNNFISELTTKPIYYGRARWNLDKMSFIDKTLCKMLIKMVSKKESKDLQPWKQALMEVNGKNCDWTDEKYIVPLIDYVLKIN